MSDTATVTADGFTFVECSWVLFTDADAPQLVHVYRNGRTRKLHLVRADEEKNQVYSVAPRDVPDSGTWFARWTDAGIAYVSSGYAESTVRKWQRAGTREMFALNAW